RTELLLRPLAPYPLDPVNLDAAWHDLFAGDDVRVPGRWHGDLLPCAIRLEGFAERPCGSSRIADNKDAVLLAYRVRHECREGVLLDLLRLCDGPHDVRSMMPRKAPRFIGHDPEDQALRAPRHAEEPCAERAR